jgi:hypothetical protein
MDPIEREIAKAIEIISEGLLKVRLKSSVAAQKRAAERYLTASLDLEQYLAGKTPPTLSMKTLKVYSGRVRAQAGKARWDELLRSVYTMLSEPLPGDPGYIPPDLPPPPGKTRP